MAKRVWRRLDRETRQRVLRLTAKGWTAREIATEVGRSVRSVIRVRVAAGGVCRDDGGGLARGCRWRAVSRSTSVCWLGCR